MTSPSRSSPRGSPAASRARWIPPLTLMAAVAVASHQPLPLRLPGPSDKLLHVAVFALLAMLWFFALRAGRPAQSAAGLAFLFAVAWGGLDEIHQAFVPGRTAELLDVVADATGSGLGCLLALSWARLRPAVEGN